MGDCVGGLSAVHELSIACELVRAAAAEAARHGTSRVVMVEVTIGALAGVDPAALEACFPFAAGGSTCEGAQLRIEVEPAQASCRGCGWGGAASDFMDPCPRCGAWPLELKGGRAMQLRALEVA